MIVVGSFAGLYNISSALLIHSCDSLMEECDSEKRVSGEEELDKYVDRLSSLP